MDIRPIDANALNQHKRLLVEHMDGYDVAYSAVPMYKVDEVPTLSLNTLRDAIYQDAVAHGLWEEADQYAERRSFGKEKERLYFRYEAATELVLDEAEELFSASYHDNYENLVEELADVVIQAFSTAGYLGIDIDAAIRRKMSINKQRPWKHEGEKK